MASQPFKHISGLANVNMQLFALRAFTMYISVKSAFQEIYTWSLQLFFTFIKCISINPIRLENVKDMSIGKSAHQVLNIH